MKASASPPLFTDSAMRVCFNFGNVCNMRCEWCYIPFDGSKTELSTCIDVVRRCADIGAEIITFGGGDPYVFRDMSSLIEITAGLGMKVHVDTNGISIREKDYRVISEFVDLLALPLDGVTANTHDTVRSYVGHFDIVHRRLERLKSTNTKIKINTIATRQNLKEVGEMRTVIEQVSPDTWSIYQFWPLSLGKAAETCLISAEEFQTSVSTLPPQIGKTRVELNPIVDRINTYLFVSHDGKLYTHDTQSSSEYAFLGSIFDDAAIDRWRAFERTSLRESARPRYQ